MNCQHGDCFTCPYDDCIVTGLYEQRLKVRERQSRVVDLIFQGKTTNEISTILGANKRVIDSDRSSLKRMVSQH